MDGEASYLMSDSSSGNYFLRFLIALILFVLDTCLIAELFYGVV